MITGHDCDTTIKGLVPHSASYSCFQFISSPRVLVCLANVWYWIPSNIPAESVSSQAGSMKGSHCGNACILSSTIGTPTNARAHV